MPGSWQAGDVVVWRGISDQRIWHAMPMIVVKDSPQEIALALLPGADGFAPEDYSKGKQNGKRRWDFIDQPWKLDRHIWHTNRLLILIEPHRYYSVDYF